MASWARGYIQLRADDLLMIAKVVHRKKRSVELGRLEGGTPISGEYDEAQNVYNRLYLRRRQRGFTGLSLDGFDLMDPIAHAPPPQRLSISAEPV